MNVSTKVEKVTAFVTRPWACVPELLVFKHPTMGLQVPTGTVALGESPDLAVIRETSEETGLIGLRSIRVLGSLSKTLPPSAGVILRMTKLFNEPAHDASSDGFGLPRGTPVQILALYDKFAEIECDVLDLGQDPPARKTGVTGYVRRSLIGRKVVRHFFHLTTEEPTNETWTLQVDWHVLTLFWIPLVPMPGLSPSQAGWLASYYSELLAAE